MNSRKSINFFRNVLIYDSRKGLWCSCSWCMGRDGRGGWVDSHQSSHTGQCNDFKGYRTQTEPEIPVSVFMMSEHLIYVSFWDAENFNRIGQKFKLNYLP